MGHDVKLSIIVPVYNVIEYLSHCIESILRQTYANWELILVDDGSTDGSGRICDEAAAKDNRIIAIHKSNGGVSSARNCGIEAASGEYISFVDADDWIDIEYCEKMMAPDEQQQFVICGFQSVYADSTSDRVVEKELRITKEELKRNYEKYLCYRLMHAPFPKRYLRTVIGHQRFDDTIALGEDCMFNLAYMEKCTNICFLPHIVYFYNMSNIGAATKQFRSKDFEQNLQLYRASKKFYDVPEGKLDIIDEEFLAVTVGLMQKMCNSSKQCIPTLRKWLRVSDVTHALKANCDLPIRLKPVQFMCKMKFATGIAFYFWLLGFAGKIKRLIIN